MSVKHKPAVPREVLEQFAVLPCPECADYGRDVHDSTCPLHEDYDPTPHCTSCGDGTGNCCTNPQADNE